MHILFRITLTGLEEYYSVDQQHLKTVIGEPCDGERLSDDCFSEADGVMANDGEC